MTATQPRLLLTLAAGFGIWAACFAVIYAIQGLGCAYNWHMLSIGPLSLLRIVLLVLAAAGTVATWIVARQLSRLRKARQTDGASTLIVAVACCAAYLAVPAIIVTFSGVLMATVCN